MGSIVILLAWTAAVAAAHAVITRPWKYPAARAVEALQTRTGADALAKLRNDPGGRVRNAASRPGG